MSLKEFYCLSIEFVRHYAQNCIHSALLVQWLVPQTKFVDILG